MNTKEKMKLLYRLDWEKLAEILSEEWNLPIKKVKKMLRGAERNISLYHEASVEIEIGWAYVYEPQKRNWMVELSSSKRTYDITFGKENNND